MNEELPIKDEYTAEEVYKIIKAYDTQISLAIQDREIEIQNEIEETLQTDLEKAALKREKQAVKKARENVREINKDLRIRFLTECCDAKTRGGHGLSPAECRACGEEDPETYEVERNLEKFLNTLNTKRNKK